MIHRHIENSKTSDHWGVSYTGELPEGFEPKVLVQLQQKGEQVRVAMSPEEAEYMAEELLKFADKTRKCQPLIIKPE